MQFHGSACEGFLVEKADLGWNHTMRCSGSMLHSLCLEGKILATVTDADFVLLQKSFGF